MRNEGTGPEPQPPRRLASGAAPGTTATTCLVQRTASPTPLSRARCGDQLARAARGTLRLILGPHHLRLTRLGITAGSGSKKPYEATLGFEPREPLGYGPSALPLSYVAWRLQSGHHSQRAAAHSTPTTRDAHADAIPRVKTANVVH